MGLLGRILTGRFRNRGEAERPDAEEIQAERLLRPPPTPTARPFERPHSTPTTELPEIGGRTAGTPSYGSPKGTPSTQRINNPRPTR
jgi:hypothetical protein